MTERHIPIAQPLIGDVEKRAVMEVLDSGQLVQGAKVKEFEDAFAAFLGVKHAVATTNGTTALTVALMACDVGPGDEVIIPSFSFMATATSVLSVNAIPVFVDVEDQTFCIDPSLIEAAITPRTKAIMPVHLYGHPANMPAIAAIAEKHGLAIIEDAAQAHGATINDSAVGGWGAAGFSFYPSKNMTTGEGGMLTTNDDKIATLARMIRNHGMNQQYYHEEVGFNFRMTNVLAAIGAVQVQYLSEWNAARNRNATYLNRNIKSVRTPITIPGYYHVYHQYTVLASENMHRDEVVVKLNRKGIGTRVYYSIPIHCQPVFDAYETKPDLSVTNELAKRVFSLPVHPSLTQEDLERIVYEVNSL